MIELKTAVLIAASMKIGAIIGEATIRIPTYFMIWKNLGLAFQIQDDMLDVWGDYKDLW